MKHFLTILCILTSFSALAQFPNTHTQSSPYTKEVFNGSTNPKKGLINGRYSDTAAANRDYVAGEKGIQIVVGNTIYMRDSTATKWIVAGGYGVTASNITILNDSSISICNGNSCDTFKFTNIVVNNFTVVNDSTILVCDGNNTCDTLFIPPTPIAKPYVDSVKVTGGDSLFYYITGKAYFGGLISPNSTSTISIYNDSTLVICNNNACDSFKTNIVISNFTVLNDSTVIVCPTSGSCDTVNINPTRFAKPYVDSTKIINGILFYYINGIGYSGGATSSFNGTSLVGGVVSYSGSGLTYNITPAYFTNPYFTDSTAAGQVTLSTADPTFSRIDAVVATKQGVDSVLIGIPSSNPELPQIDQTNEVLLTYIIVTAGETAPPVTVQTIYDQDTLGEWTPAASGLSANFASTANPYHSTKAIRISSWSNGNSITFSSPSPVSTNSYSVLTFYVYLASTLANNSNVTVQFYNGASVIGNTITLSSIYGFSKTKTGVYQPIAIPFSALGLTGNVNRMVVTFSKINSNAVDIDWIQFQSSGGTTGGGSGSGNYVTNIYRKSGTDSVFQIINNVASFAFIDSTGSSSGGTVTNFSFTNTTGITGTVTNPTTTPNLSLAIDTSALPGVHTTNFNDTRYALISTLVGNYVKYTDTASMLSPYLHKVDTTSKWIPLGTKNPLNTVRPILALDSVTIGFDTIHLPELRYSLALRDTTKWTDSTLIDRKYLTDRINPIIAAVNTNTTNIASNTTAIAGKQNTITLTTTGSSGAATLSGSTLNIPQYAAGSGTVTSVAKGYGILPDGTITTTGTITVDTAALHLKFVGFTDTAGIVAHYFKDFATTTDTTVTFYRGDNTTKTLTITGGGTILNGTGYVKMSGSTPSYLTQVPLTTDVSGILPFSNGGLGINSATNGDILFYNGGWQKLGIGTSRQRLAVVSGLPAWIDTTASTGASKLPYATVTCSAGTCTATVAGISSLDSGLTINAHFINAPTIATTTLEINSLGAKNIQVKGVNISGPSDIGAGADVYMVYDGIQWQLQAIKSTVLTSVGNTFTPSQTFSGGINVGSISSLGGAIQQASPGYFGNLWVPSANQYADLANNFYRISGRSVMGRFGLGGYSGGSPPAVTAGYDYANVVISSSNTAFASGTSALVSGLVAKAPDSASKGTAVITDEQAIYAGDAPVQGVNNWSVNQGRAKFRSGISYKRTAVADAAYTLTQDDFLVAYTSLTATRAVTLPSASSYSGFTYIIKDESGAAATNNITIVGTVDGVSNPTAVSTNYGKYTIYSNGTAWFTR